MGRRHYPDWTPSQQELLRHIYTQFGDQTAGPGRKQLKWSRAFAEHPEWKEQLTLLPDGSHRPDSHLWHTAKQLALGMDIDRPAGSVIYKQMRAGKPVTRRPYRKRAWWIEKGVPHPGSAAARAARAVNSPLPTVGVPLQAETLHFCPQCGCNLSRLITALNTMAKAGI